MTFFTIVIRGLLRRRKRTGLTILGIAVGIAAVVALAGISRGFSKSWETGMKARGTDVVVSNMGASLMNTMLMSVYERTQEICILLALGWKRRRIVRMVLWESALLGLAGGLVGMVIGAVGVKILEKTPVIRGLVEPDISIGLLATSVAIAVAVGVISGLYPAWRSSLLTPSQALHV
jgi:putative ABC transport system permease protein